MRVERPHDGRFARVAGLAAAGAGTALGAMSSGWPGAGAGLVAGAGLGLAVRHVLGRRTARRRAALALPFPENSRAFLLDRYDHFERLDPLWRARFEDDVRIFLVEKRITGVGVEATDELRLLVAASAVTLSRNAWSGGRKSWLPAGWGSSLAASAAESAAESAARDPPGAANCNSNAPASSGMRPTDSCRRLV